MINFQPRNEFKKMLLNMLISFLYEFNIDLIKNQGYSEDEKFLAKYTTQKTYK